MIRKTARDYFEDDMVDMWKYGNKVNRSRYWNYIADRLDEIAHLQAGRQADNSDTKLLYNIAVFHAKRT